MASRAGWLLVLALGAAALAWGTARTHLRVEGPRLTRALVDERRWPGAEAPLTPPASTFPAGSGVVRLMIDPGHGAPNNRGNTGSYCAEEQEVMLDLALDLADRLAETGHVAVRLTRDASRPVEYAARLEEATAWGADAFVSLHSDVRGHVERWSPAPSLSCPRALDAPGFAVLYADEGEPLLVGLRLTLGRAIARRLGEAGFPAYGGADYTGLYAPDEQVPGLFVDRHAPDQRIFVLRRASMPSILIETHNALDPREAVRWAEPDTRDAFAASVAAALGDVLARPPRPGGT